MFKKSCREGGHMAYYCVYSAHLAQRRENWRRSVEVIQQKTIEAPSLNLDGRMRTQLLKWFHSFQQILYSPRPATVLAAMNPTFYGKT